LFRRSLFFLITILFASLPFPTHAYAGSEVLIANVEYVFGEKIAFNLEMKSDITVENAAIYFNQIGETTNLVGPLTVKNNGDATYQLEGIFNLENLPLAAFQKINYHVKANLSDGNNFTSPDFSFYYSDNRFDWKSLDQAPVRIHWYKDNADLGQAFLDMAFSGLNQIQSILPLPVPENIDIYVYQSIDEMKGAVAAGSQAWVAGQTNPELGLVFLALPPGPDQMLLAKQRLPHELMHLLLANAMSAQPRRLPTWLDEGLAIQAELYPNPDYSLALTNAVENNELFPIEALCNPFPNDAANAFLAYAQSASFVNYLQARFGKSGIQSLFSAFAEGQDCATGTQNALGVSLSMLDRQWREDEFGESAVISATNDLTPWFLLLGVVLLPLVIGIIGLLRRKETA
jgi:hypothetical protein